MKVFFFDVDGTLLPSYHQTVLQETIEALEELRKRGNKSVLCTGRGTDAESGEAERACRRNSAPLRNQTA